MLAEALFVVTAYSWGCGASGFTRTERIPHHERTVAADPRVLPMFSEVAIPGVGVRYVEDTGRNIRGHRIDVFVETCREAREFGVQRVWVMALSTGPGGRIGTRNGHGK